MCEFLTAYDGWYGQHIGSLANSRITSPHLSSQDMGLIPKKALEKLGLHDNDSKANTKTPVHVWIEAVNAYLREATHTTHVNVYRAELWTSDPSVSFGVMNVKPLIPFACSVEIGKRAAADAFRAENDLPEATDYKALKQNKKFSFSPLSLSIKISEVTYGKAGAHKMTSLSGRWWKAISVQNLPCKRTRSVAADPTAAWVEVSAKECTSNGGPMKKGLAQGKYKVTETTFHASYVEVESDTAEPFDVTVDGRYLGKFFKMRLELCKNPVRGSQKKNVTLPVQSFLPISL